MIIHTSVKVIEVSYLGVDGQNSLYHAPWGVYSAQIEVDGVSLLIEAECLLNATGRAPNVHNLGLENVS